MKETPLFSMLNEQQLNAVLGTANVREFSPNDVIVNEGETATSFYVILQGQVEVKQSNKSLAKLGRGQFFGETTVADDQTRSADVVALRRTRCLVLGRQQLRELITSNPGIALKLLEESARRYRPHVAEFAAPPSANLRDDEEFEFKSDRARAIFEGLASDFLRDYMMRNYLLEKSGWRTMGEIAKEAKIPLPSLYSKAGGPSSPIRELLKRGLVEMKVSPGERGRGGLIAKVRVAYEKEPVKVYVNRLGHKKQ